MSLKPSKQRKIIYNAPLHIKRKMLAAKLSKELQNEYGIKRIAIRKGDTVRVIRGDNVGYEGKVTEVNLKQGRIGLEGLTRKKADGTPIYVWIHTSKVMITKLDTSDPRRKASIERKAKKGKRESGE